MCKEWDRYLEAFFLHADFFSTLCAIFNTNWNYSKDLVVLNPRGKKRKKNTSYISVLLEYLFKVIELQVTCVVLTIIVCVQYRVKMMSEKYFSSLQVTFFSDAK